MYIVCCLKVDHCVKCVQVRSYLWSVFSPNTGKYGPEITPYLDTFHAVDYFKIIYASESSLGSSGVHRVFQEKVFMVFKKSIVNITLEVSR